MGRAFAGSHDDDDDEVEEEQEEGRKISMMRILITESALKLMVVVSL